MAELTFERFDTDGARCQRGLVAEIYRDAYAAAIASDDDFENVEAFLERFDAYTSRPGFDLLIGYIGHEPVGQTFGWALRPPDGGWWRYLVTPVEPGFAEEDGHRTFALSEIMVRQAWTGQGIAHALHNELLTARHEQRATLLVKPNNTPAYRAYESWGWRKAAQLQGGWEHAPRFDVLILPLPITRTEAHTR